MPINPLTNLDTPDSLNASSMWISDAVVAVDSPHGNCSIAVDFKKVCDKKKSSALRALFSTVETFFPGAVIKWAGRIGRPIPDNSFFSWTCSRSLWSFP